MPQIPTVSLADRLRDATDLLEALANDRALLDELPEADRDRLLRAIAYVYSPDRYARRRQSKAETRARKVSRAEQQDALKAKGVKFEHYDLPGMKREGDVHVGGDMKVAWFKDPDGNTLSVSCHKSRL